MITRISSNDDHRNSRAELNANGTTSDSDRATKLPISDRLAEQGYIGSAILNPRVLDEFPISAEEFYLAYHGMIVRLLQQKRDANEPIDIMTLSSDLIPLGESVSEAEWDSILRQCIEAAGHPDVAQWCVDKIHDRFMRRTAVCESGDLVRAMYDSADAKTVIWQHIDTLQRLTELQEADDGIDCPTGLSNVLEGWKSPHAMGIPTGYPQLDQHIGGWQAQRLYLLAAKTAIGKSALAINFAAHVAKTIPVLLISLEMPADEGFARLASSVLRVPTNSLRRTVCADEDTSELSERLNQVAQLKFKIDDRGGRTIASISAQARKLHRRGQLGLLIVDYISLVLPPDSRVARYEQVGAISRGLKLLAKNLEIPVLALSQLSRAADGEGVRPQLHHLRESGNLEQDSDVVLLIHRERNRTEAELIVAKNRSGRCGTVPLVWNQDIVRYDAAPDCAFESEVDPFRE